MKAKKQLRKPENWQDFESLCKKLWGEIWQCPEIKKNGRIGQNQNGVDIYGIPKGESQYYGIQCKGKDDYSKSHLTEKEIDLETEKAKLFTPPLKKIYFATTDNKDVNIERYVRTKNIEFRKNGLFEVHIYSWEDIVDLIDENRETYDWYLRSRNFKQKIDVNLLFSNGTEHLTVEVPFRKRLTIFTKKVPQQDKTSTQTSYLNMILPGYEELLKQQSNLAEITVLPYHNPLHTPINKSLCGFQFLLTNNGTEAIEEYKVFFKCIGNIKELGVFSKGNLFDSHLYKYDAYINDDYSGVLKPSKNMLVPKDSRIFDKLYISSHPEDTDVKIIWELISKNYSTKGVLSIKIKIKFEIVDNTVYVEHKSEERTEENIEEIEI